mmetsp:Transcript_23418/g.73443  ORF Transcript_23418/g.73443 Transcript_23418/m.73443 type:complete len:226 (+) Transcript_23418:2554-3231(+)
MCARTPSRRCRWTTVTLTRCSSRGRRRRSRSMPRVRSSPRPGARSPWTARGAARRRMPRLCRRGRARAAGESARVSAQSLAAARASVPARSKPSGRSASGHAGAAPWRRSARRGSCSSRLAGLAAPAGWTSPPRSVRVRTRRRVRGGGGIYRRSSRAPVEPRVREWASVLTRHRRCRGEGLRARPRGRRRRCQETGHHWAHPSGRTERRGIKPRLPGALASRKSV